MSAFTQRAKETLRDHGVTQAAWRREWFGSPTVWHGDRCGCSDDRCIGFHHDNEDDCGCLPAMLAVSGALREGGKR